MLVGSGYEYARLSNEQLAQLQRLEKEIGVAVVAYHRALEPARLSAEQTAKVQALERQLGFCLVAYSV